MENNEYMQGFCRTAMAAGVNPVVLAKLAGEGLSSNSRVTARRGEKKAASGILDSVSNTYKNMDPYVRRALIGGLATGLGTYALSNPYDRNRLRNSLLGGALGGLGTYTLDSTGATDSLIDLIKDTVARLRPTKKYSPLSELVHDTKRALK